MKHDPNSFLTIFQRFSKLLMCLYLLTTVSLTFAQNSSYVAIIGGSTIDDNKEHYLEQAKSIYDVLKVRNKEGSLIFAFSSGPGSNGPEGIKFDYEALYDREFLGKDSYTETDEPLPLMKFEKDFDGDGKEDVQYSGKYDDIKKSITEAVSKLKEGDSLNVMIGNHGSREYDSERKNVSIFDTGNSVISYLPYTSNELENDYHNLTKINKHPTYEEIFSWIDQELQKKGLQGKVQIKMNAHNCFGGGVVGLTKYNVCATATNIGTSLSSGLPDPYKITKPPSPLADLRTYEIGGYWYYYYKYLKDNPEASQMDAYWHSLFRDLQNTPVSSLDYVLESYLKRNGRGDEFREVYEYMGIQRFDKRTKTPFIDQIYCNSCRGQSKDVLDENLNSLVSITKMSPLSKERQILFNKYKNLYETHKKSNDYLFLEKERERLLKEVDELRKKIIQKYRLGDDYYLLELESRGEREIQAFSKNSSSTNDPYGFINSEEYKSFKKEQFILNRMSEQVWVIKKQEEQVAARFNLYLDFIKNSNQEELKLFKDMEKCLESKY